MQSHSSESEIIAAGGWREGEGEGVARISAAALCRIQRKDSIGYSSDQCQTWWPIGYWNRWYQTLTIKTFACLRCVVAARMLSPWVAWRYFGFESPIGLVYIYPGIPTEYIQPKYRFCISRMLGNRKKTLPIHKWVYNKLKSTTWCIQLEYPSDTSKRKLHSRYRGSQVSWLPWSLVGLDRKWVVIRRFFVIYRNYPDLFQAYPPSSNTTWPSPSNHTMGLRTLPTDHIQTGHIEALSNGPFMRGLSRWWKMGDVSWL